MTQQTVVFTGERTVSVESAPIPEPRAGEVLVKTVFSAVSAGTEMLIYRNQFPHDMALDATIEGLDKAFTYPVEYGYMAVGEIIACGQDVPLDYLQCRVFAFQHHTSHFIAASDSLIFIPDDISSEDAIFLPNMETAVNLVQDGLPMLGEEVLVLGQGVVGLLVTSILSKFPLEQLITADMLEPRQNASISAGADVSLSPSMLQHTDFDLIFELSGNPAALNTAIECIGYAGRIVVGSWYGQKQAPLNLGGRFHRNRVQIISSQVSTIAPTLTARWDKTRRFNVAWDMIRQIQPAHWITHRFPVESAADTYHLLDTQSESVLQVIFTYH